MKTQATMLSKEIRVRPAFVRSVNLERDAGGPSLTSYVPTARALATLRRLGDAMAAAEGLRAWSVTGPYGSGKSYFAAFLNALSGPPGPERNEAEALLGASDPGILEHFRVARRSFGADDGFVRAAATAQKEPVAGTLLRALRNGLEGQWGAHGWPRGVAKDLRALEAMRPPEARDVAELVARVAEAGPVLLIIDEFGKNLEYLAEDPRAGDLFVLQELAELATAKSRVPLMFLTLQHLAFTDYAAAGNLKLAQRREWSKVQGRFEDIVFVDTTIQSARVIASTLDHSGISKGLRTRLQRWGREQYSMLENVGVAAGLALENPHLLTACYPLHALSAIALPELCARFGQHERTLIGFLASTEPTSVATFLATTPLPSDGLPTVRLEAVYDYFVGAAATMLASSPDAARWLEMESRMRESQGLSVADLNVLKAVAVLNLVSAGGVLRASAASLAFAVEDGTEPSVELTKRLRELERRGLLTYRDFADEYRIWRGSDFDVAGHLEAARMRASERPLAELLTQAAPPLPVVAARHSQRVGMLRFFEASYRSAAGPFEVPAGSDGLVAYIVGELPEFPVATADGKPLVLVSTPDSEALAGAAVEAAAHFEVLDSDLLRDDGVARREMQERTALAREALQARLAEAFRPGRDDVRWWLGDGRVLAVSRSLSHLLSELCDATFPASPEIRSEMLGRRELTSQGAKARRELMLAMVDHGAEERLGIDGFGPDRAMYEALLRHPEMHRANSAGEWEFGPPKPESSLSRAWEAVDSLLLGAVDAAVSVEDVYDLLQSPPFGVKEGPIPVLLTGILLCRRDEVAVYQDGTYVPVLTADVLERLVKAPERFALKSFALGLGRVALLESLSDAIAAPPRKGVRRRNPSVLTVAAPLLGLVRSLPEYTLRTSSLSHEAQAMRALMLETREPDELLFSTLPAACGVPAFGPADGVDAKAVEEFTESLRTALDELQDAYSGLLAASMEALANALSLPNEVSQLRPDLRGHARGLGGHVIDPKLASFLALAGSDELDDEQWVEAMLLNIARVPPRSWRDDDAKRFEVNLLSIAGLLRRVQALHFDVLARETTGGFDARRVTVTAPNGEEVSSVFWVDTDLRSHIVAVAEQAAAQARDLAGSQGVSALVAVLAQIASGQDIITRDIRVDEREEQASA